MTKRIEPPENWRERDVTSGDYLAEEKELSLNCPNDLDECLFYSNVPTFIKWFQSIEESEPDWCHITSDGEITALGGKIPKGVLKLQGNSRKSQNNSQIVAYGPLR